MGPFYFGIFLLVCAVIWKILDHLKAATKKNHDQMQYTLMKSYFGEKDAQKIREFRDAMESPVSDAAVPSGEAEKTPSPQIVVVKHTSPGNIAAGIILAIVLLVAVMWVWGFLEAASDVGGGMNMLEYALKVRNMNPVTRSGYDTYMARFTDIGERRERLRKIFE